MQSSIENKNTLQKTNIYYTINVEQKNTQYYKK